MYLYKCDRCGATFPISEMARITILHPNNEVSKDLLCEQCYTTIMEVLKDGDIK